MSNIRKFGKNSQRIVLRSVTRDSHTSRGSRGILQPLDAYKVDQFCENGCFQVFPLCQLYFNSANLIHIPVFVEYALF